MFAYRCVVSYVWSTGRKRGSPFKATYSMQPIWANLAALAVAVIYYVWRESHQIRLRKDRALRERVAYMLWVMATRGAAKTREIPRATV